MKITKFINSTSIKTLKIAAISSLAIGAAATMSAAPAGAVLLTGGIGFSDGTLNTVGTIPGPFTAQFNRDGAAIVSGVNTFGAFTSLFAPGAKNVLSSTIGLVQSGANYASTSDLVFDFGTSGKLVIPNGSLFSSAPSAILTAHTNFAYLGTAGTFTTTDTISTPLTVTSFNFDVDNSPLGTVASPNGSYSLVATTVPEPFTIIGTIVGGTAAFRMRKKLASKN
jgi:hypothetical protein